MRGLERLRVCNKLLGRAHFAAAGFAMPITEKQIAREIDDIAKLAAEKRMHGNAELLPDDVEAREFDRRMQLRAVVIEARGGIADREAHRLQTKHVVPA